MAQLFDPFTPLNFPSLFTLMWLGGLLMVTGSVIVYNLAQRRYRRYPVILALHEWVFWAVIVSWGIVPLLTVIHVPLIMLLMIVIPGMVIAAWATFAKFPPLIEDANDEIRRRRFVPPARRDPRGRRRATPAGGHKAHRR